MCKLQSFIQSAIVREGEPKVPTLSEVPYRRVGSANPIIAGSQNKQLTESLTSGQGIGPSDPGKHCPSAWDERAFTKLDPCVAGTDGALRDELCPIRGRSTASKAAAVRAISDRDVLADAPSCDADVPGAQRRVVLVDVPRHDPLGQRVLNARARHTIL